jgi:hypothetical protein
MQQIATEEQSVKVASDMVVHTKVVPARRKRRQKGNTVSDEMVKYSYWDQSVIALQTTDPFSHQRGRLRKKNKVIVRRKKKSKIKSGQGSQKEARYPDELVD